MYSVSYQTHTSDAAEYLSFPELPSSDLFLLSGRTKFHLTKYLANSSRGSEVSAHQAPYNSDMQDSYSRILRYAIAYKHCCFQLYSRYIRESISRSIMSCNLSNNICINSLYSYNWLEFPKCQPTGSKTAS